jgi:hypothetical protein
MFSSRTTIRFRVATLRKLFLTRAGQRLALLAAVACVTPAAPAVAVQYQFLQVTDNGLPGNLGTAQFMSLQGNGVINVTRTFTPGGFGPNDNDTAAIFPSQFLALFPGTGQVEGHLTQTNVNSASVVTFDLTGYNLSSSTVFGIWNIIDQTAPLYHVELIDAGNAVQPPTTFSLIGNQDNETQVAGRSKLVLDNATGDLILGGVINAGGTHTDAAFWNNIPAGTKQIIVRGNLPALNTGDGVGYYFAEIVIPEPSSLICLAAGLLCLTPLARRRGSRQL